MSAQNQWSTALVTAVGDDRNGRRLCHVQFRPVHGILAAAVIAMAIGIIAVGSRAADGNGTDLPQLAVGPSLEVAPSVPTEFYVRVGGPPDALPPRSYIRIENLPGSVTLSEGQKSVTGAWVVPLSALEALRLTAPDGIGQGSEFVVDLVAGDGSVLAERTVALEVTRAVVATSTDKNEDDAVVPPSAIATSSISVATAPTAAHASASPSDRAKSSAAIRPAPTREEREQGERLLSRGDRHVTDGNIAIARQFFIRAAELGLPIAAWRMAETYDPMALARGNVRGPVPDPVEARKWYERALSLGMPEANARLQRLDTR
jgi:hypothetical protein